MTDARNNFKAIFDAVFYDNEEVIIHRKELENIGKVGFNSKSFVDDKEDYTKW